MISFIDLILPLDKFWDNTNKKISSSELYLFIFENIVSYLFTYGISMFIIILINKFSSYYFKPKFLFVIIPYIAYLELTTTKIVFFNFSNITISLLRILIKSLILIGLNYFTNLLF